MWRVRGCREKTCSISCDIFPSPSSDFFRPSNRSKSINKLFRHCVSQGKRGGYEEGNIYLGCRFLFMACLSGICAGATMTVGPDAAIYQHTSIQAAIDSAQHHDEIVVAPGTYSEAINFLGKAVRVRSSGGRRLPRLTGRVIVTSCSVSAAKAATASLRALRSPAATPTAVFTPMLAAAGYTITPAARR